MTLKTALMGSPKSVQAKFIVLVLVLVVESGLSVDFDEIQGITPGNVKPGSGEGFRHNAERSFILNKKNRFHGFPKRRLRDANPIAMPVGSTGGNVLEETSKTSPISEKKTSKLQIPDEGGVVRITVPAYGRIRESAGNTTDGHAVSRKINSNSVTIPDDGGPVHIDVPDYVKYGIKKNKIRNTENGPITLVKRKESGDVPAQVPGKDKAVSGGGDPTGSVESGDVTQVSTEETTTVTSQQPDGSVYIGMEDYPFFAAVHARGGSGDDSFDDVECSGGIVTETAVVTSCSCLFEEDPPVPSSKPYYVSVGHKKFAGINATATYSVNDVKYHPSCQKKENGLWLGNIAMLMIADPGIQFSDRVRPMNLPKLRMWDASDVLAKMSDQRRHCRVIGWSRRAPLIDTAIGKLIPMDECANPVCNKNMPCPRRTTVDGFMVEITTSEPFLLPGALLYCSEHVFAIVNTKRNCPTNNVFAACSPEELLYSKYGFEMESGAEEEMRKYNHTFLKGIEGWQTYTYPVVATTPAGVLNATTPKTHDLLAEIASSAAIFFPFYISREASWMYTHFFAAGYYFFVFT